MSTRPEFPGAWQPGPEMAGQAPPPPPDQIAFMNRLRIARGVQKLPDLSERLDHTGVVVDGTGLSDRINVNMREDVLAPFAEVGESPRTLTFTPRPMARYGKEKSYRGAFFGELTLAAQSGTATSIPVVVKQYPIGGQHDAVHNAIQEGAMLEYLRSLGLKAVDLVGLIADRYSPEPLLYVITRQKQGLESLDELSWKGVRAADMPDRLRPVIDTLSSLHESLVFQGDSRFKNIGLGEDGSPIMFDLEHAASVRDVVANMNPGNEEESLALITRLMAIDFAHVTESLASIVYPNLPARERPKTRAEQFDFEYTNILEPYLIKLMEGSSLHKDVLRRVHGRVVQQRREQLLGKQ